jgi:hypothetical protein
MSFTSLLPCIICISGFFTRSLIALTWLWCKSCLSSYVLRFLLPSLLSLIASEYLLGEVRVSESLAGGFIILTPLSVFCICLSVDSGPWLGNFFWVVFWSLCLLAEFSSYSFDVLVLLISKPCAFARDLSTELGGWGWPSWNLFLKVNYWLSSLWSLMPELLWFLIKYVYLVWGFFIWRALVARLGSVITDM